jgi:2-methylisocitrate lyase-like PEP mutase family enzyme
MTTARHTLRERFENLATQPLVVPGIGTPLEARCAVVAGFEAVYQSGYATAAWRHGQPDIGLTALEETASALESVAEAVDVPIICDADTGYGDVANVVRAVRRLERMGASAIQFEDQAWPKKCGHMRDKTVIPARDHARKVMAAVRARQDPDTIIIARTDALAPHGMHEALERAKQYADAGADAVFVDAPASVEDLQAIAAGLPGVTLLANMSESGLTPHLSAQEFHDLGFDVVLFPTSALRIASRVMTDFFAELRQTGDSRPWVDRMMSLDELNVTVGLPEILSAEAAVLAEFSE